ncbi:MAG: hypothetical protein WCY93_01685 [Anaerolineaceae bacterium]
MVDTVTRRGNPSRSTPCALQGYRAVVDPVTRRGNPSRSTPCALQGYRAVVALVTRRGNPPWLPWADMEVRPYKYLK